MPWARSLSENHQFQASNEALSDFIAKYPTRLYDLSTAFFLQSYNYMQLGAYYQAMVANRESLALKEQLALEGVGENFMRSGAIYLLAGDLYRAEEQLLAAKEYPIESAEVYALIDGYLGAVYMEQGELERAAAYFRQSVESLQIDFGDDHPDLVTAHYHLGLLALEQRQYEEAEVELRKALGIAVKLRQHRTMGQIYNALAKVYERTAPDQAYSTYDKAISLLTRQFGRHHVEVARTHMNLSRYYLLEEEEEKGQGAIGRSAAQLAARGAGQWLAVSTGSLTGHPGPRSADRGAGATGSYADGARGRYFNGQTGTGTGQYRVGSRSAGGAAGGCWRGSHPPADQSTFVWHLRAGTQGSCSACCAAS